MKSSRLIYRIDVSRHRLWPNDDCSRRTRCEDWVETHNRLLTRYTLTDAGVKYAAWKSDPADMKAIQDVVDGIANEESGGKSRERSAFAFSSQCL